jgi:NAD(P)-dependent dehydrogenase (short-subunit alcohol dehydrogenase family)
MVPKMHPRSEGGEMPHPIAEQVIVITGASSGVGLATAKEAARRGARVVLSARSEEALQRAVTEIESEGGYAIAFVADVTRMEEMEALARRAVESFGRIDTWVNNAGVSVYGRFDEVPPDDFHRVMDVTFMGQVNGARAALPHLERSGGALICVGSGLSDRGAPLQTAYDAAKHAVKGWIDGLRVELMQRASPVRVTLIKPASMNTPFFSVARTYLGVQPGPIAPVYAPELAARAILHAAEHDERDLYVGGAGKALSITERISPRLLDFYFTLTGTPQQTTSRPKDPADANNLQTPHGDARVRGDYPGVTRDRSAWQWIERHPVATIAAVAVAAGLLSLRHSEKEPRRRR